MKQTGVWRLVAAAMSAPDQPAERDAVATLAASPTDAVVEVTEKLCRSRRADERRVGELLTQAVVARHPGSPAARRLGGG